MKSFYDKEDYTIDDIQALITDQVEESIYLDFKEAGALDKGEKKRLDISKDVASFANSDGGIIVYGLKEEIHVASEMSFINGNDFTKEWLEQVVNSSIQRNISGLKIYPVRKDGNINETIYIVKIPASLEAPHISKDNRYYRRHNFMSVPMEEYEVRGSYSSVIGNYNYTEIGK
jgi:predicted HTH transcriptional regulator